MSQIRMEMIWQHNQVLPYILGELKDKINAISLVQNIYLYGSRARTPISEWEKLAGKDWDIIVVAGFAIINTTIWTKDKNYHIDLKVVNQEKFNNLKKYSNNWLEIYPNNPFNELLSQE